MTRSETLTDCELVVYFGCVETASLTDVSKAKLKGPQIPHPQTQTRNLGVTWIASLPLLPPFHPSALPLQYLLTSFHSLYLLFCYCQVLAMISHLDLRNGLLTLTWASSNLSFTQKLHFETNMIMASL